MLTWIEVDAPAIRHNLEQFRSRLAPGTRFGAVVKGNAYGHGLPEVAGIAAGAGADWFCVNSLAEGIALRDAGHDRPVLVMGYVPIAELAEVVGRKLRPVVYSEATVRELSRLARQHGATVPVHLKIEAGTHRQGVPGAEALALAERIDELPGVELEGAYTHFANIEDTTDHSFAEGQIAEFERLSAQLRESRPTLMRHAACSAATLLFHRVHLDLVRVGISLYGIWSSPETRVSCRERGKATPELRPAMTWKTRIAQVKEVAEGAYVGYGCSYRTTRNTRIAVLPVGYHEGYDRRLSSTAHVLIDGRRAAVCGRVCMNMCMVDVTDIPGAIQEAEVVLLGAQGDERVTAEQLASWCGTIPYEVVTRIHPGLPRRVIGG